MVGPIKENGKITKWMDMVSLNGQMGECTKVSMWQIRSMEKGCLNGQMVECTMVSGRMVGSMVWENI